MAAGEGIETMLSHKCALPKLPIMAALSAAHLPAIRFSIQLRRLYIARDADRAGTRRGVAEWTRSRQRNRAVVLSPRTDDFNGDLRALGIEGLRRALR
jgi:hypothetical protein